SGPGREIVRCGGAEMAVFHLDGESGGPAPLLIWAHGWGHTHRAFLPLAESVRRTASSILIDFPGFGASPPPPAVWGTADYADAMRPILGKAVSENVVEVATELRCAVAQVYGDNDPETTHEIGERLQLLSPNAQLHMLRGFDHLNVLLEGQHQLTHRLTAFLE